MREYLFRGKRKDNGEWVEGYYVSVGGEYHFILTGKICFGQGYANYEKFRVDPETVGQYTGLADRNGVKIFEGDIVKSDNGTMAAAVFVVCYGVCRPKMYRRLLKNYYRIEPTCMDFGLFGRSVETGEDVILTDATQLFEVIGNIHDNLELLKEGGE